MACVRDSGTTANALHDDISVRRPHAFLSSTCRVLIVMCMYGYVELLPPHPNPGKVGEQIQVTTDTMVKRGFYGIRRSFAAIEYRADVFEP